MPSLVEELQREALDSNVSIVALMRKAYVVASKLNLRTFRDWCKSEQDGYDTVDVPEYRRIGGNLRAFNPYRGWIPVVFSNAEMENAYSTYTERSPISVLEDLITGEVGKSQILQPLPSSIRDLLMKDEFEPMECAIHITRGTILGILTTVRNTILDWSLKLEADGIVGDKMSFNPDEKRIAIDNAESLQAPIYIFMHNSSIQHASPGASQNHG